MQNFTFAGRPLATSASTEFCMYRSRNVQAMYYIEIGDRPMKLSKGGRQYSEDEQKVNVEL